MNICRVVSLEAKPKWTEFKFELYGTLKKVNIFPDDANFPVLSALKPGQTVNLEIEKNSKNFDTITEIGAITEATTESVKAAKVHLLPRNSQQVSIERQVALKGAIELFQITGVQVTKNHSIEEIAAEVLNVADGFFRYISSTEI